MLSRLQERVRQRPSDLPGGDDLALAGGAALIVWGVVSRPTQDLDFFATSAANVNRLVPEIESALAADGLDVKRVQIADGFARLAVSDGTEETLVDVAWDARMFPREVTEEGPLLAVDEVAGDKLLALFGRAAARDFVDVDALIERFGLERLCELAAAKDPGFDRRVLADMLGRFDRLPRAEFAMDDTAYAALVGRVRRWALELTDPRRDLGPRPPGPSLER
jgi:hypothetical protein